MQYDVVFHVDQGQTELNIAISNITNYFKALPNEQFTAVLLVNGPGAQLMGKDSPNCQKLQELCDKGLQLLVCNNAVNHFGVQPEALCPPCRIVPAGIVELVNLQRQGFVYVKP